MVRPLAPLPYGTELLDLPLHGTFNAFNVAAAIATLAGMGFSFSGVLSESSVTPSRWPNRLVGLNCPSGDGRLRPHARCPAASTA